IEASRSSSSPRDDARVRIATGGTSLADRSAASLSARQTPRRCVNAFSAPVGRGIDYSPREPEELFRRLAGELERVVSFDRLGLLLYDAERGVTRPLVLELPRGGRACSRGRGPRPMHPH